MKKFNELKKSERNIVLGMLIIIFLALVFLVINQKGSINVQYECCHLADCKYYNETYNSSENIIDSKTYCEGQGMFKVNKNFTIANG